MRDAGDDAARVVLVENLAAAAAGGDSSSLGELYEMFADPLYRYVYVRVGSHADAEDVCSDVWLKVARKVAGYSPRGSGFPGWLFTIARTTVADHYRTVWRRPETPTEDMVGSPLMAETETPEDAAVREDATQQLLACITKLRPREARVVMLRFFHGLTIAETASVLGSTVGAVKVAQHRAVRKLATVIPDGFRIPAAAGDVLPYTEQVGNNQSPAGLT